MGEPPPLAVQIAAAYEQLLVPRIHEPWARVLLERLDLKAGETLVDVATGPGTLARLASIKLGGKGRVIATDLSSAMLMLAQQRTGLPGVARIDYVEGPAVPLPVADATAQALACQQGLQYFGAPAPAFKEMRRVLKPGGRLAVSVWAEISASNVAAAVHAGLKDGGPSELADVWKAGYGLPTAKELETLANGNGFYDVKVERLTLPVTFDGG